MLLGAPRATERRHARGRGVETDHRLVRRDREEQRPVGVSVADDRVDFQDGMGRVARVFADAVVHDPLEHGGGQDPHATDLAPRMTDEYRTPGVASVVDAARADVRTDPDAAEQRGLALMRSAGDAIIAGVDEHASAYLARRANEVLDAWQRVPAETRPLASAQLQTAAATAQRRVTGELRALLAVDPAHQTRTPLEIVRSLREEPTAVLSALGVGEVVRDEFEERALPDDPYGFAPRTLAELGDDELGPMLLAWGIGKATVLRARAARVEPVGDEGREGAGTPRGAAAGSTGRRKTLGTIAYATRHCAEAVIARARRALDLRPGRSR